MAALIYPIILVYVLTTKVSHGNVLRGDHLLYNTMNRREQLDGHDENDATGRVRRDGSYNAPDSSLNPSKLHDEDLKIYDVEFCVRGQFLNLRTAKCETCPEDSFMNEPIHTQIRCYKCHHARNETKEVDLIKCTPDEDTTIGCRRGYYLHVYNNNPMKIYCHPCSPCSDIEPRTYLTRQCSESVDTLCCHREGMVAVPIPGSYGYSCQDATDKSLM